MVRVAAWRGPRAEEVRRDVTPVAESVTGRIIRERRTHHIPDLRAEPDLSALVRERVERLGSASLLYAPMLWEDRGLGSILVARSPPRPFSDREQALLQSFADQAAIAIENARLFDGAGAHARPRRRWSSRQRPPTCSRRSAVRRSISDRSRKPHLDPPGVCATRRGGHLSPSWRHLSIRREPHALIQRIRRMSRTADQCRPAGYLIGRVALKIGRSRSDTLGRPGHTSEKDEIRRQG